MSGKVKTNVRRIMAWYGAVLNLTFTEVTETSSQYGQIRVMRSTAPSYAYAYYPTGSALAGDVHLNPAHDDADDTNGFQHDPGEARLRHPDPRTRPRARPEAPAQRVAEPPRRRGQLLAHGDDLRLPRRGPSTGMGYDLLALYRLYGARATRTADDVYAPTRAALDQAAAA